jgi:hypothetical protein
MEEEARRNTLFVLHCANQFPRVEIDAIDVTPATGDLFWVDVVVKNDRVYPTSSDREVALGTAVKDRLAITFSPNVSLIEVPAGVTRLDPTNDASAATSLVKPTVEFRLKGNEVIRFRGLVKATGKDGWIDVRTDSRFGGKDGRRISIKIAG